MFYFVFCLQLAIADDSVTVSCINNSCTEFMSMKLLNEATRRLASTDSALHKEKSLKMASVFVCRRQEKVECQIVFGRRWSVERTTTNEQHQDTYFVLGTRPVLIPIA